MIIEYLNELIHIQGKERIDMNSIKKLPTNIFSQRYPLVNRYSWAVPNLNALETIKALSKDVVEIGAGQGYWGKLLRELDVKCHLYDQVMSKEVWTWVQPGGPEKAFVHSDCALLLCWPPYDDPMAYECLNWYCGDILIYIGESSGGCTADDQFHELLDNSWNLIDQVDIPQWWGLHDYMSIYKRPESLCLLK